MVLELVVNNGHHEYAPSIPLAILTIQRRIFRRLADANKPGWWSEYTKVAPK